MVLETPLSKKDLRALRNEIEPVLLQALVEESKDESSSSEGGFYFESEVKGSKEVKSIDSLSNVVVEVLSSHA